MSIRFFSGKIRVFSGLSDEHISPFHETRHIFSNQTFFFFRKKIKNTEKSRKKNRCISLSQTPNIWIAYPIFFIRELFIRYLFLSDNILCDNLLSDIYLSDNLLSDNVYPIIFIREHFVSDNVLSDNFVSDFVYQIFFYPRSVF